MDFESSLELEMKAISELQNRIYPLSAPEANKKQGVPYLIYGSSGGQRDKSLDGYLKSKEVRVELNVVTDRYSGMKNIAKQVIAKLITFEGRVIGVSGPYIEELTYQAPVEMYENQPKLHRSVIEFTVYFNEED